MRQPPHDRPHTTVVDGSGGEFSVLSNSYRVAQYMADTADVQHAVGGLSLRMVWRTPDGSVPTTPGTYSLEVHATDSTGHRGGFIPITMLSTTSTSGNWLFANASALRRSFAAWDGTCPAIVTVSVSKITTSGSGVPSGLVGYPGEVTSGGVATLGGAVVGLAVSTTGTVVTVVAVVTVSTVGLAVSTVVADGSLVTVAWRLWPSVVTGAAAVVLGLSSTTPVVVVLSNV